MNIRRGFLFTLALALLFTTAGCMAVATTANLKAEEEEIVEITLPPQTDSGQAHNTGLTVGLTPYAIPTATPGITMAAATPSLTDSPEASPSPSQTPMASPSPTIAPTQTPAYELEDLEDKKAYLNAGSANMRKGPGTDYEIMQELKEYATFTVTARSGEWYRIKIGSDRGFVLAEFIEFGSPPTPKPTATPKPAATPKPTTATTPKPTATPSGSSGQNGNDYFSDGGGFSADELLLIAQVVHEEAKGSSTEAQAAVANVIYNRIKSSKFPNSVSGVIFQKYQFTVADHEDTLRAVKPSSKAVDAVNQIFVSGVFLFPENVLYFRSSSKGTSWSGFTYYDTIGGNSFFTR